MYRASYSPPCRANSAFGERSLYALRMVKGGKTERKGSPKRRPAREPIAPATKPRRTKALGRKAAAGGVKKPKVVSNQVAAAIALALGDEAACAARETELREPPSPWTLAARASGMRTANRGV